LLHFWDNRATASRKQDGSGWKRQTSRIEYFRSGSKDALSEVRNLEEGEQRYPDLGVGGLGLCQPDERCQEFHGPVDYACRRPSEEDGCRGSWIHIKTLYIVRVFDWSRGLECEIELSEAELGDLNELLAEMKEQREKDTGLHENQSARKDSTQVRPEE